MKAKIIIILSLVFANSVCFGQFMFSAAGCPAGVIVGESCDDGDPNTYGTTYQEDCMCGGGTVDNLRKGLTNSTTIAAYDAAPTNSLVLLQDGSQEVNSINVLISSESAVGAPYPLASPVSGDAVFTEIRNNGPVNNGYPYIFGYIPNGTGSNTIEPRSYITTTLNTKTSSTLYFSAPSHSTTTNVPLYFVCKLCTTILFNSNYDIGMKSYSQGVQFVAADGDTHYYDTNNIFNSTFPTSLTLEPAIVIFRTATKQW